MSIADKRYKLNTGAEIPALGLGRFSGVAKAEMHALTRSGTWKSSPEEVQDAVYHAIKVGYRHIDSAQFYGNEAEVGQAVRESGIPRNEVFITTKIMTPAGSPEATYRKVVESVDKIAGKDGYVDLFLIHSWKSGESGRKELWQALERLLEEGRTRSIGVSNYGVKHIEEMKAYAKVWPPHVNQIEVSGICNAPDQRS